MADSLQLLQGFITRGNKSEDLPTFINNNQDSLSLYSGKLKYDNSVWRSLVCGVRFFHGNGFLEFMKWENTCNGIYCPEFTDTGRVKLAYKQLTPICSFVVNYLCAQCLYHDDEENCINAILENVRTRKQTYFT